MMIIISGGQIGVDQAALDAAIEKNYVNEHFMGYCPAGRRAIGGTIPTKYAMIECSERAYPPRTQKNIETADATLVLHTTPLTHGTGLTLRLCKILDAQYKKVSLTHYDVWAPAKMATWLYDKNIGVLNIAGPSKMSIYTLAYDFVIEMLDAFSIMRDHK